jgi:sulfite reductase (NADPH) hemoprotein beta-component
MYQYTAFDQQFIRLRAAQFRDQLERYQAGQLGEDEFKPLRLQNGWYIQRYAPMVRIAVPYGELSSAQLRVLAQIARDYDKPDPALLQDAQTKQNALSAARAAPLPHGCGHFTTRHNVQFNWIPLDKAADVMDLLASVDMHGIQTSGNTIRNISTEELAGIAADEIADPRPFCEILRQWSTLHPEFAFLPRKFKVAVNGAEEDRAATGWYDVGLQLKHDDAGELGFQVRVGGGMGRTPVIGSVLREFLPWNQIMNYLEAVIRVYNRYGRRDNLWKARIKILVKAEGQRFIDEVEAEYRQIVEVDGAPHTISQEEFDRVAASFVPPAQHTERKTSDAKVADILRAATEDNADFGRWLARNVAPHKNPDLRAVTLSFKRIGQAPGDCTAEQFEQAADLADRFSAGEARVTHAQNLLLPWVRCDQLPELWAAARAAGLARANIGLLTDMIVCPGGDFCSLANARSLPIAAAVAQRYQDLDELDDLGAIDLHMSGCINSCGHHHSGHIGVLGVDKDGQEWYQVSLGGADGTTLSGPATPGKIVGPSFTADEVPEVIEAVLNTYRDRRNSGEPFIHTLQRIGQEPFKAAANAARISTARPTRAAAVPVVAG